MGVRQNACVDVVLSHGLQKQLLVLPKVAERKQLHHLPEPPLNANSHLAVSLVERSLRGGEVRALKTTPHVAKQRICGVTVHFHLRAIRILDRRQSGVELADAQEVRVMSPPRNWPPSVDQHPIRGHHGLVGLTVRPVAPIVHLRQAERGQQLMGASEALIETNRM